MGKKHQKHRKSDKFSTERDVVSTRDIRTEPPLKLVLKVGGKSCYQDTKAGKYDIHISKPASSVNTASEEAHSSKESHHQKKKKKKKRKQPSAQLACNSEPEDKRARDGSSQDGEQSQSDEIGPMDIHEEAVEEQPKPYHSAAKKKKLSAKTGGIELEQSDALDGGSTPDRVTQADRGQTDCHRSTTSGKGDNKDNTTITNRILLKKVLESLQKTLQRKDVDQFFAWPVNDVIAPGYSSIIQHPMDFSSMKKKIDNNEYYSVDDYKADFSLMCDNATIYNRPETIYYKAAKRLHGVGLKCFSKDKLLALKRGLGYHDSSDKSKHKHSKTSQAEADIFTEDSSMMGLLDSDDSNLATVGGSIVDGNEEVPPEDIIGQILDAAKGARERLSARCPNSKLGFLRCHKSGTTTLAILNPTQANVEETKEVNLEMLTGKLSQGTGSLPGFREDKRNKAIPVTYLSHGPFNSHGPQYDSSFANISKEDSDLLYSTYGDEAGIQYAQSIMEYIQDCDNYVVKMVGNLLDTLTRGQHSKTVAALQEKSSHRGGENSSAVDNPPTNTSSDQDTGKEKDDTRTPIQFESLRSLSDLGIDMSFLPAFEELLGQDKAVSESAEIDQKLKRTSELINDLERTQSARLSQKPPNHLHFATKPSEHESNIAEKLTRQLLHLTSKIKPLDVVSIDSTRAAMGITMDKSELGNDVKTDIPASPMPPVNDQLTTQNTQHNVL